MPLQSAFCLFVCLFVFFVVIISFFLMNFYFYDSFNLLHKILLICFILGGVNVSGPHTVKFRK